MSKQENNDDSAQPDAPASTDDASFDDVPEPVQDAGSQADDSVDTTPGTKPPARRGGGIAWLALLLALVSLAGIGYLVYQDWRSNTLQDAGTSALANSVADLDERAAATTEALEEISQGLTSLRDAASQDGADLDQLQRDFESRVDLLDSLPPRVATLENSFAALQGVSAGARETFLIAEAEYYMQIANAQLQLAGNPQLAALALGMADERIVQLANPALTGVRRAIADELAALDGMEKPDIEGITLTLASLSRVVGSLPLRPAAGAADSAAVTDDADDGRMARAWSSVRNSLSGLVKVTPPNEAEMPLIAPDQVAFLRANLALQLQTARLALLRGETAVFEQSLDDAAAWLRQYFDTSSTQVASALDTMDEIRGGLFAVAAPDISASLQLLRQYQTLAETAP